MHAEQQKITPFYEDVYVYDLNQIEAPPLAYRSARGGEEQPDFLSLMELSAREWHDVADRLYDGSAYLFASAGAVILPIQGSIGRLVAVVKTSLSLPAFAYLAQHTGQGNTCADTSLGENDRKLTAQEREVAESAVDTVEELQWLISSCLQAHHAYDVGACIDRAAEIMGVSLMPLEKMETVPMQGQGLLPEMQHSGQALFACILTVLSTMRNCAHARSGWLYAVPCEQGYTLQAFMRCAADADLSSLDMLRGALENSGVMLAARTFPSAVKPPKQYAYMSRKITDPRKPLCVRCHCLDKRCASCTAVQWAVLPYVCDVAVLGIKAESYFKE